MRANRILIAFTVVLCCGLVVTSVGWFRSSHPGDSRRFDSCQAKDGAATLRFTYGVNEKVTLSTDSRDDGIVVDFRERQGDGATPAVGLLGEFRIVYSVEGGTAPDLRYEDGESLDCEVP